MGQSDSVLYASLYYPNIALEGDVALLGFKDNQYFKGDCYDLELGNWDINSKWELDKKYDTIVSLRCPYFAKDPEDFIKRCHGYLNENGKLYIDWGLGDHWRFDKFKVGWVKEDEHEYYYKEDNFLWSTVWNDKFLENEQFNIFKESVKELGYEDIKKAVYEEVPSVMEFKYIEALFQADYKILTLWSGVRTQLYVLVCGVRR